MVMVAHQYVGMVTNSETLAHGGQEIEQVLAITVAPENGLSLDAATGDVIPRAGKVDAQRSGHGPRIAASLGTSTMFKVET